MIISKDNNKKGYRKMEKRVNDFPVVSEKRLLDVNDVCIYLSLGRNKAKEFGKNIGAQVKIGKRVLYDRVIIDSYFNKQAAERVKEVV